MLCDHLLVFFILNMTISLFFSSQPRLWGYDILFQPFVCKTARKRNVQDSVRLPQVFNMLCKMYYSSLLLPDILLSYLVVCSHAFFCLFSCSNVQCSQVHSNVMHVLGYLWTPSYLVVDNIQDILYK